MEPVNIREAILSDADVLADLAKKTFPLACPEYITANDISIFLRENLSEKCFIDYLNDFARKIFIAEARGLAVGYTMLVRGVPRPGDTADDSPAVELSKCYLTQELHGRGVAGELLSVSVSWGKAQGAAKIWLGVNQANLRAQRFYAKHGFVRFGTRQFLVGRREAHDYLFEHNLCG